MPLISYSSTDIPKGHFRHETESPWPLHFKHSHWWKRQSWSKFASHYARGINGVSGCKMDVKSTWILTWYQRDHVFMVTWTIIKNHLLEVGLTQNREITALRMLTTGDLFYFIMGKDPHEKKIHWNSIWWRAGSHMTSHYTWGSVTTLHNLGGVVGRPSDTFFWALTISWSRLSTHVWSGPR